MNKIRVFVACSSQFRREDVIKYNLDKLLSSLEGYEVCTLSSSLKIVTSYFKSSEVLEIKDQKHPAKIRKLISECEYCVFFWDGTELEKYMYESFFQKKKSRVIPVETTKVVNKDKGDEFEVYIGRGTPWGNPFAIGDEGMTRNDVIEKYREYFYAEILKDPEKRRAIESLRGKTLGCHCKPADCHGDVIADYLNSTPK